MSNLGKWDDWYQSVRVEDPQRYGDATTYEAAAEWLTGCETIADWGCGKGGFKPYTPAGSRYVGIDGSATPFATEIADLAYFRYPSEGVLLRHVLEHDHRWRMILQNAVASYTQRMMVVLFTPVIDSPEPVVEQIGFTEMTGGGVPDLAFSLAAIAEVVPVVSVQHLETATQYGVETVLRFER